MSGYEYARIQLWPISDCLDERYALLPVMNDPYSGKPMNQLARIAHQVQAASDLGVRSPDNRLSGAGAELGSQSRRFGVPWVAKPLCDLDRFRGAGRRPATEGRRHQGTCGRRQSWRALAGGPDWVDRF